MARKVRLDMRGLEEVATSREMAAAVEAAAERVESAVRSQGIRVEGGNVSMPVKVYGPDDTTNMRVNRAKARVTLAHPAGLAVQAKYGALTKAAAEAGLRVRGG